MTMDHIEMDVWVRGNQHATTRRVMSIPGDPSNWTDDDVRALLVEMLLAIDREKNPDGDPPPVTLRGFSWIVSPYEGAGVVLHLEMPMGTASAGPFRIDADRLTSLVARVMSAAPESGTERVH